MGQEQFVVGQEMVEVGQEMGVNGGNSVSGGSYSRAIDSLSPKKVKIAHLTF